MDIRFTTFNLYQFVEPPFSWYDIDNTYSNEEWIDKVNFIKDKLYETASDVVGFQEVFSVEALREIVHSLGYHYFEYAGSPKLSDDTPTVFVAPVCAIASKFPISKIVSVKLDLDILTELNLSKDFSFSREPIKAFFSPDGAPEFCVYVCHLKSKRPLISSIDDDSQTFRERVFESAGATSRGQIAAMIQRGAESTSIYHDAINEIRSNGDLPILILGDLNDSSHSVVIDAISNQSGRFELTGIPYQHWPHEAKLAGYQARLFDIHYLMANQSGELRKPTHYFKGVGTVLDYIFISNALNPNNPSSSALLSDYSVSNAHLKPGGGDLKVQSDHGLVTVTISI